MVTFIYTPPTRIIITMTGPKDVSEKGIIKRQMHLKPHTTEIFFLFLLILFLGLTTSTVQALTHPCLIFNNITETPGYQHRTESPWSSWESSIISSANNSLSRNFSDPNWSSYNRAIYRSSFAKNLALAYQITGDTAYADKAKEALLNMDIGDFPYDFDYAFAVMYYSLAYDWVQPYLNSTEDETVRDKLATLADELYYRLNDGGTNPNYISFSDYHGREYPAMGIVGCVLSDYTNPNNLSLNSTPSDWFRVGTHDLFVNDTMHPVYNKSLVEILFGGSGKYSSGLYKIYWYDPFMWWCQVYSHFTGKNIFDDYPIAKNIITSELWDTLPNRYSANYQTLGNTLWSYQKGIVNLLDSENRSYILNYLDTVDDIKDLLPYSREYSVDYFWLYLVYDDYSTIQRKNPSWTSHFDPTSFYQVFRGSWRNDSDWFSLITWPEGFETQSNRNMAHHDQLSFEYYSKGDLLLADGGEDKHILDHYYGGFDIYHNTVMIEDPRSPFDIASWSGSRARGMYKGEGGELYTPAYIKNLIQTPWMEIVDANATVHRLTNFMFHKHYLSSPINYERAILYPEKDYFAIIDRLEGSESWTYRNVFRPTSLNITPSTGTTESEVGHVNIDLTIGSIPYDWLSLPYKTETPTGITTNSIRWNTTNPYGNKVNMHLFSAPASEIRVTKHVTRIAGTGSKSEVFLPLVYFRSNETNDLYRVTVLLARYPTEEEKIPENIPVTGNGTAVKVTSSDYEDFIYTGKGESSFGDITTDAKTLFLRKTTQPSEYTFTEGSYVSYSGSPLFEVSSKIDYLTLKKTGENITFKIKGTGTVNITLYQMNPSVSYQVKRDGITYSNWVLTDDGRIIITTDLSEHTFEIEQTTPDTIPPSIANITVTNITSNSATITWQTNEPSTSLVKYGTSPGNYTLQKYDSSPVTSHSITLTDLSPNTTYYFVVNSTDACGNTNQSSECTFSTTAEAEDKTPPSTTLTLTPQPDERGWINSIPVVVTFFRSDGVAYTNYSLVSQTGPWTTVNISTAVGPDAENVTDISEGRFNVSVTGEGVTTIWYYSVDNNSNIETTKNVTVRIDTTPPASISDLHNTTGTTWINWTWTNPSDDDFAYTMVYLNGVFKTNTSNPYYNATNLTANTTYEIGTHTVDVNGNVNDTWMNQTARILAGPNSPPYKPGNPSPADGAVDIPIDTDLSWSGGDPDAGDTVTYDVYFGTDSNPPMVSNDQLETTYDPGTLDYSTLYYWRIVAKDEHGASNESEVWCFTTASDHTNSTLVQVSPVAQTVLKGQNFRVNISVSPGTAIAGMQLDLLFNSSLVEVNSVTEGDLFKQDGASTHFNPGTIDNATGIVTYVYGAIIKQGANVSTPGTFAIVNLTASDTLSGTSPLALANVKVSDPDAQAVPINVTNGTVTVRENEAPVLSTIGDKSVNEGSLLEFTISAYDPDGDTLTYSASNLPSGASFDASSRTFSWTPTYDQAGTYTNVHFEVSDGHLTDSEDITITVHNTIPRWDVNEDSVVDIFDLVEVGQHFNESFASLPYPRYDVNQDGVVDIGDVTLVGQHFGEVET